MKSKTTEMLLGALKTGKENAVSRQNLALLFDGSDGNMRRAVAQARLEGVCICNEQDGGGYYLPDTQEELKRQYSQTLNRARAIFAQLKYIREKIGIEGQLYLELESVAK